MPKDLKEPDIVKIVNDGIVPRLDDLDLARDYNANQLQRHYRNNTEVPYSYIKDIDFKTMAKFSEHDVGLPGVDIAIKPVRSYVYGAFAAHLLGYVGAPDDTNKEEARRSTRFTRATWKGNPTSRNRWTNILRGQPGHSLLRRNAKGQIDGVLSEEPPQAGRQCLSDDRRPHSGDRRGSVARGRPRRAQWLSIRTTATFWRWSRCHHSIRTLLFPASRPRIGRHCGKTKAHPLINRAISAFPPGSTFKLVTALAGLRKGSGQREIQLRRRRELRRSLFSNAGSARKAVHPRHARAGRRDQSFVRLVFLSIRKRGRHSNRSTQSAKMLGLGEESGIAIDRRTSRRSARAGWMPIHHPQESWSQAYTANVSIGQGYDLVSPLQLAMVYATVANGGICYYPRLVDRYSNQDGTPVLDEKGKAGQFPRTPKVRADLRDEVSRQNKSNSFGEVFGKSSTKTAEPAAERG